MARRFGGGELWFDVCGTMMSRHGVKPDSLREHKAQVRFGLNNGHVIEKWIPELQLIEQANYMKFSVHAGDYSLVMYWGGYLGYVLNLVQCWDIK